MPFIPIWTKNFEGRHLSPFLFDILEQRVANSGEREVGFTWVLEAGKQRDQHLLGAVCVESCYWWRAERKTSPFQRRRKRYFLANHFQNGQPSLITKPIHAWRPHPYDLVTCTTMMGIKFQQELWRVHSDRSSWYFINWDCIITIIIK